MIMLIGFTPPKKLSPDDNLFLRSNSSSALCSRQTIGKLRVEHSVTILDLFLMRDFPNGDFFINITKEDNKIVWQQQTKSASLFSFSHIPNLFSVQKQNAIGDFLLMVYYRSVGLKPSTFLSVSRAEGGSIF